MTKGMGAIVVPVDDSLPPSRDALTLLPKKQAVKPPDIAAKDQNALEPTIYRFILRHSIPQQLLLLVLTLVSFPFLYFSSLRTFAVQLQPMNHFDKMVADLM